VCETCEALGFEISCKVCGGFDLDDFKFPGEAFDRLCESCLTAFREMAMSWQ
jgi:hypothetical protein